MMRVVRFEHKTPLGQRVCVVQNDLTLEKVDAIVNAANEHLSHGGGVAAAISGKGGPVIQQESTAWVREHGPVLTGSAAITSAGRLPCRYVIHAVGPVWGSGNEDAKLSSAVRSALDLADRYQLRSVSMPGISSGVFGFPKPLCARVMLSAVIEWLTSHPASTLQVVNLSNIDGLTTDVFCREAEAQFAE